MKDGEKPFKSPKRLRDDKNMELEVDLRTPVQLYIYDEKRSRSFAHRLHITVPPIHVVCNHVGTDKLTTANGGTFTSSSARLSSQSR